jgi:predicted RNA-binding protein YlxR (DUF448 family)
MIRDISSSPNAFITPKFKGKNTGRGTWREEDVK